MSRRKIPIPEDFAAKALELHNAELKALYGISESVITQWRKALSAPAPKANRKGVKRSPPEIDTPEQIAMCLHCKLNYCDGLCLRMKLAKRGTGVCYT